MSYSLSFMKLICEGVAVGDWKARKLSKAEWLLLVGGIKRRAWRVGVGDLCSGYTSSELCADMNL